MRLTVPKLLMSLLCLMALGSFAHAQDPPEKEIIAILDFTHRSGPSMEQYARSVQNAVETGFVKSSRFVVVERSRIDALVAEMQTQEVMSDDVVANIGKTLGASYVVLGNLESASAERQYTKNENGQREAQGYKATVSFQVKIVEVESAQIKATEQIITNSSSLAALTDQGKDAAIAEAINRIDYAVEDFIIKTFPIEMFIIQITEEKRGKAEMVEVLGGSELGLHERDRLAVVIISEREIRGRVIRTANEIGELRVESITGPETCLCKVMKGDEEIFDAMKNGTELIAIFYGENKSLFGR